MVLEACPDIVDYAKGGISNWRDLLIVAAVVRSVPGISPSAWEAAQSVMGELPAAIVVAAILQRGAAITSAGGYLRELTRKAQAGEFSLGPMLMALMAKRNREKEEGIAGWRAQSAQKAFLLSRGYRRRGDFSGNAAMSSRHGSKTAAPQCCKSFVLRETR